MKNKVTELCRVVSAKAKAFYDWCFPDYFTILNDEEAEYLENGGGKKNFLREELFNLACLLSLIVIVCSAVSIVAIAMRI